MKTNLDQLDVRIQARERTNLRVRGVDFVRYPVTDLDRAARFYREILGLSQELYNEQWQWAEFNCGNVTLALHGGVKLPGAACLPGPAIQIRS
jgi:hypothetical protein